MSKMALTYVCDRCGHPFSAHGVFHDEPPERMVELPEGCFRGHLWQGVFCPTTKRSKP